MHSLHHLIKLFTLLLSAFILAACGSGGDDSTTVPPDSVAATSDSIDVTGGSIASIDVTGVSIDIDSGQYSLVTEASSAQVSSASESIEVDAPVLESALVILADGTGEPILLANKHAGDDAVDVSIDSSAEVFVLMSARFFGLEFTDTKELSLRIRSHASFTDLVTELKSQIESDSPCPMDPNCSFVASMIADKISEETVVSDLVN